MTMLAGDHGLKLSSESDALDVLSSGLAACIFQEDDLHSEFFDLSNGVAGAVFQKFVNYQYRVAFVLSDVQRTPRIRELVIDHENHPYIRFFSSIEDATAWLS